MSANSIEQLRKEIDNITKDRDAYANHEVAARREVATLKRLLNKVHDHLIIKARAESMNDVVRGRLVQNENSRRPEFILCKDIRVALEES